MDENCSKIAVFLLMITVKNPEMFFPGKVVDENGQMAVVRQEDGGGV